MAKKFKQPQPQDDDLFDSAFDDFKTKAYGGKSEKWAPTKRCYEDHPPLNIGGFKVYGGSCSYPVVKDADIYMGLDFGLRPRTAFPWEEPRPFQEYLFEIQDMQAPKDFPAYDRMVRWLAEQIKAGKKVHIGCIGGHGRTGTVLATLVKLIAGEADAITYVRKHYCEKAVETDSQIKFLEKHYGITPVKGSKMGNLPWSPSSGSKSTSNNVVHYPSGPKPVETKYSDVKKVSNMVQKELTEVVSVPIKGSVWGDTKLLTV